MSVFVKNTRYGRKERKKKKQTDGKNVYKGFANKKFVSLSRLRLSRQYCGHVELIPKGAKTKGMRKNRLTTNPQQ